MSGIRPHCFFVYALVLATLGISGRALAVTPCSCASPRGEYSGVALPQFSQPAWTPNVTAGTTVGLSGGFLNIDSMSSTSDNAYFMRSWGALNSAGTTVEARMRLDDYSGDVNIAGAAIWVEDDRNAEVLLIRPGGIQMYFTGLTYAMNTMDTYHTYRIVSGGSDIKVFVDGTLAIDGTGTFGRNTWAARNMIVFGDGSYAASSRSSWDYVRYYNCTWQTHYSGDALPHLSTPFWPILTLSPQPTWTSATNSGGVFRLDTLGQTSANAVFIQQWGALSTQPTSVETRMKLDAYAGSTTQGGASVSVETDTRAEVLLVRPGGIRLYKAGLEYPMDTQTDFHTYCIDTSGKDISVYVDGTLAINGVGTFGPIPGVQYNWVGFGDSSSVASSQTQWDFFQYNKR